MNQVTEQVMEQVSAESATATTNQLTSTEGVKGVNTSSASMPSDSMTRYVFLYSRQKPWIPASTGRPPGVLQPPASPPTAGEASSKVTWQLVSADSASAAEYPAQPPPMTTISLGRERRSGGCRAAGSDQAIDKSGTCMRRSGSRVLASSRAPLAEPLVQHAPGVRFWKFDFGISKFE